MFVGIVKEVWRYPLKSMAGERQSGCSVHALGIHGDRGWAVRDEVKGEITTGTRIPLLMQCSARYRNEFTNGSIPPVDITLHDGTIVGSDDPAVNSKLSAAFGKQVTLWPLQPATNKAHYRRANLNARLAGRLGRIRFFRSRLSLLTRIKSVNDDLREAFSREAGEPIPDISILPPEILEFTSPRGTYFNAYPIHLLTTASLEAMRQLNPAADWDVRRFRPNLLIETDEGMEGLPESEWSGKILRIGSVELQCEIPTVRCGMTIHAQAGLAKDPSVLRTIVKNAKQNLGIYASVSSIGDVAAGDRVAVI